MTDGRSTRFYKKPIQSVCSKSVVYMMMQSKQPRLPTRFNRSRCFLVIQFFIVLAVGATMFQAALLVRYWDPSQFVLIAILFTIAVLILILALFYFKRILELRSKAMMTTIH